MDQDLEQIAAAADVAHAEDRRIYRHEDYLYDLQQQAYWNVALMMMVGAEGVDASIPPEQWRIEERPAGRRAVRRAVAIPPSRDIRNIANGLFVEGTTWWPGASNILQNISVTSEGEFYAGGARLLNLYRPSQLDYTSYSGTEAEAAPWLDLVRSIYPQEAEHLINIFAHMVQCPGEKCNTATLLVGEPGIGKDSMMEPVRYAIGLHNSKDIHPDQLFQNFNPWVQSVMLVINEARSTRDEYHATTVYNLCKTLAAAPPNWLPINVKYMNQRYVRNVLRIFVTTNELLSMYMEANDRRWFVCSSPRPKGWAATDYYRVYWSWLKREDGFARVAAYLARRNLAGFDASAPPPQTAAFRAIVHSWGSPEHDPLVRAVEAILEADPDQNVIFGKQIYDFAQQSFDAEEDLVRLMKSRRKITHRMEALGWVPVSPESGSEWRFKKNHEGVTYTYRSRMAFVRKDATRSQDGSPFGPATIQTLIDQAGQLKLDSQIAAAGAIGGKGA